MSNPSCEEKEGSCDCKICRFFTETIIMKKITAMIKRHNYHYDAPQQVNRLYAGFYQSVLFIYLRIINGKHCSIIGIVNAGNLKIIKNNFAGPLKKTAHNLAGTHHINVVALPLIISGGYYPVLQLVLCLCV